MSHRAAVYMVQIRKKGVPSDDHRLLGDFDEDGNSLRDLLASYFTDFKSTSADETKIVRATKCDINLDEVRLVTQHGQNGVAAEIVDPNGELQHRQMPDETQLLRCCCLFYLPSAKKLGWLAVHVNHGRGIKSLLQKGITERLSKDYPDLMLQITPYVEASVLKVAADNNLIDKVKLIKYEKPNDRAIAATNDWIPVGTAGKLELNISARGKGMRVLADRVRRFLNGETGVFDQIVEFQGLTFDEAKVEVALPGEGTRTFNIEKPDSGHAFTEDIDGLILEGGEPTIDSIFIGLRHALDKVVPKHTEP